MTSSDIQDRHARFFNQVKRQQPLIESLQRHRFSDPRPYERVKNPREVLIFEKPAWVLPPHGPSQDRVCVYFESIRRADLRLRVDLLPHRVRPGKEDPFNYLQDRALEQAAKSKLLQEVRERLIGSDELRGRLNVSARSLRDSDRPLAMTAVKFDLNLPFDCTPEECAIAFAEAIDLVSPLVDQMLAEYSAAMVPVAQPPPARIDGPHRPA